MCECGDMVRDGQWERIKDRRRDSGLLAADERYGRALQRARRDRGSANQRGAPRRSRDVKAAEQTKTAPRQSPPVGRQIGPSWLMVDRIMIGANDVS